MAKKTNVKALEDPQGETPENPVTNPVADEPTDTETPTNPVADTPAEVDTPTETDTPTEPNTENPEGNGVTDKPASDGPKEEEPSESKVDTYDKLKSIVVGIIGDEKEQPSPISDSDIDKIADSASEYGESAPIPD